MAPITSDSVETVAADPDGESVSRLSATPEWLLRVSIESVLIMISILLALAVDQWRENRSNRQLALQSLQVFDRELRRNLASLDDVIPYHNGLRDVAAEMAAEPERIVEVRSIIEGFRPVVLQKAAWEAALATGALRHIDVETVSALSLTYSNQERVREELRTGAPRLVPGVGADLTQMKQAVAYLTELTGAEQELRSFYVEALQTIAEALGAGRTAAPAANDTTHAERR